MNFKSRTVLRVAISGAVCGFIFIFAEMILENPTPAGPNSFVGDCCEWLSTPLALLIYDAQGKGLLTDKDLPTVILVISIYWMVLGAIISVAVYCLAVLARKLWRIQKAWGQRN